MRRKLIYRDSKTLKWLTAIVLSVNCFAFSLIPGASEFNQSQSVQIERVVSSKSDSDDTSVSYQKVAATVYSFHVVNRSREYEKNLSLSYQTEVKVILENISEKLHSFIPTNRFHQEKIIPQDSDKDVSPSLFV